jgi:hypothetical protein
MPATRRRKPVFPFDKFPDASVYLGPEMRSTGEGHVVGADARQATEKAWIAAGSRLPQSGNAYISLNDRDKRRASRSDAPSTSSASAAGDARHARRRSPPAASKRAPVSR